MKSQSPSKLRYKQVDLKIHIELGRAINTQNNLEKEIKKYWTYTTTNQKTL